jgi:hypothetical protein
MVAYTKLSPNNSGQRKHAIDRITPHCVVGQCSIESLGTLFAKKSTGASSNYGIGADGRVGLFVEERNRSWCSSSADNDNRAVTIECASDAKAPYAFKEIVYQRLIELCTDICRRNGKKKLLWCPDKATTLGYVPKEDEMVLTVHRWFANKSCPGDWMFEKMGDLAAQVTAALAGAVTEVPAEPKAAPVVPVPTAPVVDNSFKVRVSVSCLNVRSGPGTNYQRLRFSGIGTFTITEVKNGQGSKKGWGRLGKKDEWISLDYAMKL